MTVTIVILALAVIFFVWGKIRSDVVALCALVGLLVFQILTPEEGLAGFANSTVIMMAGLFVVGGAILQTGLAKMISAKLLKLAGDSETKLFLLVMLVTAVIGAFVSNTGTVALMLPIVVSMANKAGMNPSRLLMPLAFASTMGGMMTLIGTPPNMIINDALVSAGYKGLGFFSFLPVGIISLTVGILVLLPLTKVFLDKKRRDDDRGSTGKSLGELVREYGLAENLFRVRIKDNSESDGKTIQQLDIRKKYNINVLEVRRNPAKQQRFLKASSEEAVTPEMVVHGGDVLYINGSIEDVNNFVNDNSAELLDEHQTETNDRGQKRLAFYDVGIAEILLMSSSAIINKSVRETEFREKYNVNVLGIRRKKEYLLHDIADVKIHEGDVLLVQGAWGDIGRLRGEDTEWVVLGEPMEQAQKVTLDYKAPTATLILILMVALMVLDFIPIAPVTAVLIAAILMVLTGCIRSVEAAYKTINWQTIVLFAAMLPMSTALEKTGVTAIVSEGLVNLLGGYGPTVLLAGIYLTTMILTMFLSNTVTAVLMATIALQSAVHLGVDPTPFLLAVSVGASMCFASPFSTPPNALVMPAGQYTFMDYIKVGLPLQLIMMVVMVFVLPLIFPF